MMYPCTSVLHDCLSAMCPVQELGLLSMMAEARRRQQNNLQAPVLQMSMSAMEARAPERQMAPHAAAFCAPSHISVAAALACVPHGSRLRSVQQLSRSTKAPRGLARCCSSAHRQHHADLSDNLCLQTTIS